MSFRYINLLVIHCTATPNGNDKYNIRDIDAWHCARGFRRSEENITAYNTAYPYVGYHTLIDHNGHIISGRGENEVGAHAEGHNDYSLSVCLFGTDKYSREQWEALTWCVNDVRQRYGEELRIIGHRQVNHHKTCPGFDVPQWLESGMQPLVAHLL